jgi:hypothetical protein
METLMSRSIVSHTQDRRPAAARTRAAAPAESPTLIADNRICAHLELLLAGGRRRRLRSALRGRDIQPAATATASAHAKASAATLRRLGIEHGLFIDLLLGSFPSSGAPCQTIRSSRLPPGSITSRPFARLAPFWRGSHNDDLDADRQRGLSPLLRATCSGVAPSTIHFVMVPSSPFTSR